MKTNELVKLNLNTLQDSELFDLFWHVGEDGSNTGEGSTSLAEALQIARVYKDENPNANVTVFPFIALRQPIIMAYEFECNDICDNPSGTHVMDLQIKI